ncbi:hypothetical protein CC2G_012667 [Coprinopsis cinerea AmutBmut pab1-1]|nr:hypothetical protein CC2G_012667 [Coprinopsis cinerea AmutBmut pab1-1]
MKSRRASLQSLMHSLLPIAIPTSSPSSSGEQTPRSRSGSTAASASSAMTSPLASEFPPIPPSPSRASPPPDFLLDDDPFANLTSPTKVSRVTPHSPSTLSPPEVTPLSPTPRSPLTADSPKKTLVITEANIPRSRPRAISGARQPQPAYTRPAFTPRPSLPSLSTLAKMNVVLTKKVRKGRVGAGLPFEPWDNPNCELPPRVLQDVNSRETESLPPGTQPLLPSQILEVSSSSPLDISEIRRSHVDISPPHQDVDIAPPSHGLESQPDQQYGYLSPYNSGPESSEEGHTSHGQPATFGDTCQYTALANTTDLDHETTGKASTIPPLTPPDYDYLSPISSQASPFDLSPPTRASLARSVSNSSTSSASSNEGLDPGANQDFRFPFKRESYHRLDAVPDPFETSTSTSPGQTSPSGLDDGITGHFYAMTRSSSDDSDSLKSPPESEYNHSPFSFTSTSYFPPYACTKASVDRVASWRMGSQTGPGSSSYLSDLDLSDPLHSPTLSNRFSPALGEHEGSSANGHACMQESLHSFTNPAKFTLQDPGFGGPLIRESLASGATTDYVHDLRTGFLSPSELGAGSCPSSADTIRASHGPGTLGSGGDADHEFAGNGYARAEVHDSCFTSEHSPALLGASVAGIEDGGDGPRLGGQGSDDELGLEPNPKKAGLNSDGMMSSHTLFDNDNDMYRAQRFTPTSAGGHPGNMDYGYGYGAAVDGSGRDSGNGAVYRTHSGSNQDHGNSAAYYTASSHYTTGRGRGGDDDDDGQDDRRRRLPQGPYSHASNGARSISSSSRPSTSASEDDQDSDSTDDYGQPSGFKTHHAPPPTASSALFPSTPGQGGGSSDDDDVPLAQRIPTALTAQKSIRKKVREEREQRRAKRERAGTAGESSDAAIRERERHATLRPAGAGGPLLPPLALSSSMEAAFHATTSAQPPLPSTAHPTRQRTLTMPSKPAPPPLAVPFSAEDLTLRLQNVQLSQDHLRQPITPGPPTYESHGFARTSFDTSERTPVPVSSGHARGRSDKGAAGSPPSPTLSKPSLRPMRSFNHGDRRKFYEEQQSVPLPKDAEQKIALSRQATMSRPQVSRSRGESISASAAASTPHSPAGRYRSLSVTRRGDHHPSSGYDEFGVPLPPVPPLPTNPGEPTQQMSRKLVKPQSHSGRPSLEEARRPVTKSPNPPPVPLPVDRSQIVQQRIFIGDMQRFNMVEIASSTTAGDVVEMIEAQGTLKGIIGSGGWMVWEVAQDFGMERPIRSFELLSDVQASWNRDKMVNLFVLKLTPLAIPLSRAAIPSSSPVHSGYVEWEVKRGKWSKRWMQLREHSIWLSKRDNGKDEVMLCSLSNFDAYHITRSHKAPKPFAFAVKSTDNFSYFENAADYLHTFACNEKDGRIWMEKILIARSYVFHQERQVLFNPKAAGGNASGALSRAPTSAGRKSTSQRPPAPLISVPPPYNPKPLPSSSNPVFEPGTLLHGKP